MMQPRAAVDGSSAGPFPPGVRTATAERRAGKPNWPYRLTVFYFILEYARPMDLVPLLGKLRPALFLSIILLVVWLNAKNKQPARSSITTSFILFLGWMLLHGPFSVNEYWAFYTFRAMVQFFVVYLCIATFTSSEDHLDRFHLCMVTVTIFLAFQGIMKQGRVGSYFLGDENDFCLAMNVLLPFSFFPLFGKVSRRRKMLCLAALILSVLAIAYSFSRGGFLGLVAVVAFCWWKSPNRAWGAAAIVVAFAALLLFAKEGYWSEMETISDRDDPTRRGRIYSWKVAYRIFKDYPLGVGAGSYPFIAGDYDFELQEKDRTIAGRAAHSLYFTVLPELGIPGVFIFAFMVAASFKGAGRALAHTRRLPEGPKRSIIRIMALGSVSGMVGYLVSGAFISVLYYPHMYYLMGMIAASGWAARREVAGLGEEETSAPRRRAGTSCAGRASQAGRV